MAIEEQAPFNYVPFLGTTHAVVEADGSRCYPSTTARFKGARGQQLAQHAFAPERLGNTVSTFHTGETYFTDVATAICAAQKSVFITGWQVNWDVQLIPRLRLIDALKKAIDNGAYIYVMPWCSPKIGLNTGDLSTMLAVFQLNAGRKSVRALCCPAGLQNDYDGIEETFFSHHQKSVVIDNRIAYIGGLDLAYGRRDTANFDLAHGWRTGAEIYNPGVPPQHELLPSQKAARIGDAELLKTTLVPEILDPTFAAKDAAKRFVFDSSVGRTIDSTVEWWRNTSILDQIPDYLKEPPRLLAAEFQVQLSKITDEAESMAVRRLDNGLFKASQLTELVHAVARFQKNIYVALVGAVWVNARCHPSLFNFETRATPPRGMALRSDQPRMPWQDVHCRIEGPSVYDVSMNFIARWNSLQRILFGDPSASVVKKLISRISPQLIPSAPPSKQSGGVSVRVLRSASLKLQQQERTAMTQAAVPIEAQHEIHDLMCGLIEKAQHFVYIENQFFQSELGEPSIAMDDDRKLSGPMRYMLAQKNARLQAAMTRIDASHKKALPSNQISDAIARRIEDAIRKQQPFHVYMVLPVHPEGKLSDMAIAGQVHWTYQSLVHGSKSLVNRIKLSLGAFDACIEKCLNPRHDEYWRQAVERLEANIDPRGRSPFPAYTNTISTERVRSYLTLLNLRNCAVLDGKVRTEQIYIHSKLLIVDDLEVVMGSANINDRSLRGDRDSEIAVHLRDTATSKVKLDGVHSVFVRTVAHELRVNLWKKHFGLKATGLVQPATGLIAMVDKPADPATWKAVQRVADANQAAYAKAFDFCAQNGMSLWPVWPAGYQPKSLDAYFDEVRTTGEAYTKRMPFSEDFWKPSATTPPSAPKGLQGFLCSLPLFWTQGESNHPGFNMALLTLNDSTQTTTAVASASQDKHASDAS